MSNRYSGLDALRGFAAVYVAIGHIALSFAFLPAPFSLAFRFGQEAVILFFLLSGFVIYLAVGEQEGLEFRSYFIKRFRRIYPPVIISILICSLIYYMKGGEDGVNLGASLIGNLLMLQDFSYAKPGSWINSFPGNPPLWSLSYEWWFYILFYPLYRFLPVNDSRVFYVAGISSIAWISYLVFPNHLSLVLSYLIIWWSGLELAAIYRRNEIINFSTTRRITGCLGIMVLLSLIPLIATRDFSFGVYPFLTFRHFCAAFVFVCVGILWWKFNLAGYRRTFGLFAGVGSISYAIYLFHYPLVIYWEAELILRVLDLSILTVH